MPLLASVNETPQSQLAVPLVRGCDHGSPVRGAQNRAVRSDDGAGLGLDKENRVQRVQGRATGLRLPCGAPIRGSQDNAQIPDDGSAAGNGGADGKQRARRAV